MSQSNSLTCVTLLVSALALVAGTASAATIEPVSLDDIVQIDALGFSCVNEKDLERAFAATGKKDGVVPQSCLPKPCDRLLDADQLSEFLGRDPTDEKWDEYVSRYADYCVAETGGPWPDDVLFANASNTMDDFWKGFLEPGLNSGVGSEVAENIVPSSGVVPPTFTNTLGDTSRQVRRTTLTDDNPNPPPILIIPPIRLSKPDPENPPIIVPPSPVPLPGSMALLFGAFGATWIARKVAKRSVSA